MQARTLPLALNQSLLVIYYLCIKLWHEQKKQGQKEVYFTVLLNDKLYLIIIIIIVFLKLFLIEYIYMKVYNFL